MRADTTEQKIFQIWLKRITTEGYHLKTIKKGIILYHFLFSLPDVVRSDECDSSCNAVWRLLQERVSFAFWWGCCHPCLENGWLLLSVFPSQHQVCYYSNIIRDLYVLSVIFPYKRCQLLTLIFLRTTSVGDNMTLQWKGQEKMVTQFLFEK